MTRPVQLQLFEPDPDLLRQAFREFLTAKRAAGRTDATLAFYGYVLARFGEYADWPPRAGDVQRFLLALRREGKSQATLASYWRGVRAFCNWCVRQGLMDDSPLATLDRPAEPDPAPRAIPMVELGAIFETMAARADAGDLVAARDHAMFRLMLDCMLRCSEAANCRVSDVDLARQQVTVRRGKGGKRRHAFYGSKTDRALRAWLSVAHPGCEWLFVSMKFSRGLQALTRTGVYQAWRRWCKGGYRVHDLRHSGIVYALRRGINPREVSDQAGHASVAFTLRVYSKISDEDRRASFVEKAPGDLV